MAAGGQKRSKTSHRTPKQESEHWSSYGSKHKDKNRKRVAARAKMIKAGVAKRGDGKDVDHKDKNTANNSRSNLRVVSRAKNRAHPKRVAARGGRATRKA
jgi:hypothetical protein